MPRLEQWRICSYDNSRLTGIIHDDEVLRFDDGTKITTSSIVELNEKEGYCQTKNTRYVLGKKEDNDADYNR